MVDTKLPALLAALEYEIEKCFLLEYGEGNSVNSTQHRFGIFVQYIF